MCKLFREGSYVLDEDKIAEEERYDGYYAIATNLEDPARDILAISRKRYLIEDCFRVMKTNFRSRPVNHSNPFRIKAHFLICYTALLVYRLLECKLADQNTPVATSNLIATLKNTNVANIHDVEYMALYEGSKTLDALVSLTGLDWDRMHYRPKEISHNTAAHSQRDLLRSAGGAFSDICCLQISRFTSGVCRPVLAENSPLESFPGARTQ